ncbi:uncharacterized protein NPIL_259981 [Nephila pilipes]|uniref:Uncharacterized protein n=1 Tax=Nephila pilipes TaxID=299642 RepID=A0A8X6KPU4_NEPPI|nr:uncharacterized protein NPIL_259981 [Nephila pilipes]
MTAQLEEGLCLPHPSALMSDCFCQTDENVNTLGTYDKRPFTFAVLSGQVRKMCCSKDVAVIKKKPVAECTSSAIMKPVIKFISKWHIAFACAILNFLHLGLARLVALQFLASLERYNVNREQASFPYVFRSVVSHLSGPFIGYLGCKFGLQRITILGCYLSSIAIGICFFAENIHVVTLCYGVISGFGYSMANNLLPSILSHHFKNDFMTANGVSLAGSSIGALAYVPFYDYILNTFGLSGSFLILSAFTLNAVPAAMLLKIPDKKNATIPFKKGNWKILIQAIRSNKNKTVSSTDPYKTSENSECIENKAIQSLLDNKNDQIPEHYKHISRQEIKLPKVSLEKSECLLKQNSEEIISLPARENECNSAKEMQCFIENIVISSHSEKTSPTNKQENSSSKVSSGAVKLINENNSTAEAPTPQKKIQRNNTWRAFSVIYNPIFLIISYVQSSLLVIILIIMTVQVDFAVDIGIEKSKGKYILMFEALWNFIGRISTGWVIDKKYLSIPSFSALVFCLLGLSLLCMSFSTEICGLLASLTLVGISFGILLVLCPVMASHYFEGKKKVFAVASRCILLAPMSFLISPLIGFFRENLGSYTLLFCFVAVFSFISSILSLLLPYIDKCANDNNPPK